VLLVRVAGGDPAALATLYRRYGGRLFGYLQRYAGDRMVAEEILQDTLLAVWRSAPRYAGRSGVRTWLFGIARRTVLLSTHIVDDVAQTCTELAVLGRGKLIYRGTVRDLTAQADGHVWSLVTSGQVPPVGTVVAALPHDGATRYRIVAATRPAADAEPTAPTLEDGYVALAQQHRLTATETTA